MTTYARLNAAGEFDQLVDVTPEQFALLEANGKAVWLRLWVVDPLPTPSEFQVITNTGIVIGATEAHQTWGLRDKTPTELEREANEAERPILVQMIAAITADIDAFNPNPDVTGTAVERLGKVEARVKELERQQRRDNRILRNYLRGLMA